MEKGPQPQEVTIKGQSDSTKDTKENTSKHPKNKEKLENKARKPKKVNKGKKKPYVERGINSYSFSLDDITNNEETSALITDLVKCYTGNSTLPQEELSVLNKTLYEKTVSLFLHILNSCVDKIFNKLVTSDSLKNIFSGEKIKKRHVICQTEVTYSDY